MTPGRQPDPVLALGRPARAPSGPAGGVCGVAAVEVAHTIRTMSYGPYSGGLDIEGLQRVVAAINYPGLKLAL